MKYDFSELEHDGELLRAILNATADGILVLDAGTRIILANHGAAVLAGYGGVDALRSSGKTGFDLLVPEDRERASRNLRELVETGAPRTDEYTALRADGDRVPVELSASLLRDPNGAPRAIITVIRDVTARKRVEAAIRQSEEFQRQAKEAAETASRAKSEFLANMSHEIRTPLTAILGYADIMLDNPTADEAREAAETIKRNGEHLLQVISDILDLSKIEAGRLDPTYCRCSPHQIVADVVSLMRVRTQGKGLHLAAEYGKSVPQTIQTDPLRLRQILINLVGNAVKFTKSGGIRIVTQLAGEEGGEPKLRFDVIDTGIGLNESQIARLFQPFAQIDGSATRRVSGSGLGLVISKRLAGLLGGDITVRGSPGKGSTFSVAVAIGPLDAGKTADRPGDPFVRSPRPSGGDSRLLCRVLLAEDGPDNQRLISLLLRKAGAEVTVADNGEAAVKAAVAAQQEGRPFDVVLMDMQMPVMDGYEATARLRRKGFTCPILALTAHALPEDRQKCLNAGCDEYLSKPISPKELVRRIGAHLKIAAVP